MAENCGREITAASTESRRHTSYGRANEACCACGGGRDIKKRPTLGKLAGKNADIVIITNEDPYDDDPQEIIDQVFVGAVKTSKEEGKDLFRILDRREAIRKAVNMAEKDDIVLITGKGSEQAMVVGNNKKVEWDDRVVVKEELGKI